MVDIKLDEQIDTIRRLEKETTLKIGEKAYIISSEWYNKWKAAQEYIDIGQKIPEIDNKNLMSNGKISPYVNENYNYKIITKAVWDKLFEWYGGGPEITVDVIKNPKTGQPIAVVHYITVELVYGEQKTKMEVAEISLVSELKEKAKSFFSISSTTEVRLVDYYNNQFIEAMEDNSTLRDYTIRDGQAVLVDTKDNDGKWKGDAIKVSSQTDTQPTRSYGTSTGVYGTTCSTSTYGTRGYSGYYNSYYQQPQGPGKIGFSNLGNTCFFNSGTQCLMHSMPLISNLLKQNWDADINITNPLGMKGKLVTAFHALAQQVWSGSDAVLSPSELKHVIGEFAPQFSDWGQHDSHELISFMLDGIHEDLNRCKTKPIVDSVTGDGSNDEQISEKSWQNHLLRNNSIITDNFYALLRSRLVCPQCHKVTVVFDPYDSLSLPLAKPNSKSFKITYIPFDFTEKRRDFELTIQGTPSNESVSKAISSELGKEVKVFVGSKSQYYEAIKWGFGTEGSNKEYFAFEVPDDTGVYVICSVKEEVVYTSGYSSSYEWTSEKEICGQFIVKVANFDVSVEDLEAAVREKLKCCWEESIEPNDAAKELIKKIKPKNRESSTDLNVEIQWGTYSVNGARKLEASTENKAGSSNGINIRLNPKLYSDSQFSVANLLRHAKPEKNYSYSAYDEERGADVDLMQCFQYFIQDEVLDEQNQWFCPHCRQFVCASKKMDIWSAPKVIVIQLKRFSQGSYYFAHKDERNVSFPDELDMNPIVVGPQKGQNLKYRLYAVSEHMGGMGGGHYTAHAFVANPGSSDGEWYSFNDSSASKSDSKSAHSSSAYVLFYERIDSA